jgi:N6-L-threonylcarbamoyladenine synthase
MKILSIETSCDETAISIVGANDKEFKILGNALISQIEHHKEYGGVFPTIAKREHTKNLIPLLRNVLSEADFLKAERNELNENELKKILEREPELLKQFLEFIPTIEVPNIDAIAVTAGPGLEPALWVGINFARALALVWNKPIIPVNHMEGHIFSALLKENKIPDFKFPMLALLISGGHTQLVLSKEHLKYEIIGETLDDAVGEAFDKVARMMGLPYPGGPEISKLASLSGEQEEYKFPRPMIHSDTCDFSFSGLKTSVLYTLKKIPELTDDIRQKVAKEFEDAVIEVLISKTKKALTEHGAQTLVIGGGVSANKKIKQAFEEMIKDEFPEATLYVPQPELSTDNAIMIAVAGYFRYMQDPEKYRQDMDIKADGNLSLDIK